MFLAAGPLIRVFGYGYTLLVVRLAYGAATFYT